MKKIIFVLVSFFIFIGLTTAKVKVPNKKEKEQLTEYLRQTLDEEFGFNPYFLELGESYNGKKTAKYIYFEQDLNEEEILEANLTDKMVYELEEIEFEKFEKLSNKNKNKLLDGTLENINEDIKKDIAETISFSVDGIYSFFNVSFKFKNAANEEKIYLVENLFISYLEEKGYKPSNFHFLNNNWIDINKFERSKFEAESITKGWYLLDRNFLVSYDNMKMSIESSKPRGIEKELLDYYGTYKIYSTSYLFNGTEKRYATNLENIDLLYFDYIDFSYKLTKGYSSYIMDAQENYIGYNRNEPTFESNLVRFIIDDKAKVITETKQAIEKNSFQSGTYTYYEFSYKFDSNKTFMLKNTHKTQAVEMQFGSDRYYPIYETVLITDDSPLYGKKAEMKNYRHKAK